MKSKIFLLSQTGATGNAGAEQLWLLGDQFVARTARQHFTNRSEQDCYAKLNFNTTVMTGNFNSDAETPLGRLRNILINAINSNWCLPKWIVLVMENDVINSVSHAKRELNEIVYNRSIEWLMKEYHRTLEAFKEKLPYRSRKYTWPYLLCIEATNHINYHDDMNDCNENRDSFNASLRLIQKSYQNMVVLPL